MKVEEAIKKVGNYENLELFDNRQYIDQWEQWYKGNVADFHNYRVYNGKSLIQCKRYTLGMAKKVCEDWANLLMNEKTDVTIGDKHTQEVIEDVFKKTKFWKKANKNIEKTFALGMGAWVVGVDNLEVNDNGDVAPTGTIKISFLHGKKIIPITIEDDDVKECAFINVSTNYVTLVMHVIGEDGFYHIYTVNGRGSTDDNYTFDFDNMIDFNTKGKIKWFTVITPNIANNIDIDSPLGLSIFANSIDTLKKIDLIFDSEATEFALGKKRVFVNVSQMYVDTATGEEVKTFDSNDILFYVLPESDDGSTLLQDSTQTLRISEHQLGLQEQLNILSYQCGLGTEHYKFDKGGVATATQVISENSEMFRNIKKHEIVIEDALISIVEAIIYAVNTFTAESCKEDVNVEVKFDDSIIEDKESEKASDRIDVQMGAMSLVEYRMKWYNEDEATAEEAISNMDKYKIDEPTDEELFEDDTKDNKEEDNKDQKNNEEEAEQ